MTNHYDSTVEKATMLPNSFVIRSRETSKTGPSEKKSEVKFDQTKHVALVDDSKVSIAPQTYDYISLIYAVRARELKEGQKYSLMGFDGKNKFATDIEVLGKEDVMVGTETRKAIKVSIAYGKEGEKPNDDNEIRVWFSDDAQHTPLVITANPPFGLIKVELKNNGNPVSNTAGDKKAAPSEDRIKP